MAYEIFARKYRPETFKDVVGQDAVAETLRNAVKTGRVAPVYVFAGSHGVGKTSMARILAKALNCLNSAEHEGAPCATCEVCRSIAAGDAIDVVEIDAASNRGIDDARQLREGVYYRPASLRWKVYILDEFHQLSKEAFDALLKTFEEAPEHVVFLLATTELHKVPNTILSRAQVFQFKRATMPLVVRRLRQIAEAESIAITDDALEVLARRSRGSLRDSQKLFDQVVALAVDGEEIDAVRLARLLGFSGVGRIFDTLRAIRAGEAAALLDTIRGLYDDGSDPGAYVMDLLEAFRGLLYLKVCPADSPLIDELLIDVREVKDVAEAMSQDAILAAIQVLSETSERMRRAREERVLLELALVRLSELSEMRSIGELIARLERLERAVREGLPVGDDRPAGAREGGAGIGGRASPRERRSRSQGGGSGEAEASGSSPRAVERPPDRAPDPRPKKAPARATDCDEGDDSGVKRGSAGGFGPPEAAPVDIGGEGPERPATSRRSAGVERRASGPPADPSPKGRPPSDRSPNDRSPKDRPPSDGPPKDRPPSDGPPIDELRGAPEVFDDAEDIGIGPGDPPPRRAAAPRPPRPDRPKRPARKTPPPPPELPVDPKLQAELDALLAGLAERWATYIEPLPGELRRALESGRPTRFRARPDGAELTITCTDLNAFLRKALERESATQSVADGLGQALNRELAVRFDFQATPGGRKRKGPKSGAPDSDLEPIIQYAEKALHARLMRRSRR